MRTENTGVLSEKQNLNVGGPRKFALPPLITTVGRKTNKEEY